RREAQRRPRCSQASQSRTAETAYPALLRHRRASTAASQVRQEKRTRRVCRSWRRGRMTSRLKAILSWYEGADRRCRDKIFGDIFFLAFGIFAVRRHEDFSAHDAEQAFVPGIEHPPPRIPRVP